LFFELGLMKERTIRPPVSPFNVSDSHWIPCHTVSFK